MIISKIENFVILGDDVNFVQSVINNKISKQNSLSQLLKAQSECLPSAIEEVIWWISAQDKIPSLIIGSTSWPKPLIKECVSY